jgi:hypothetical protein
MTSAGVWRLAAYPEDGVVPELADEDMWIAASPEPGTTQLPLPTDGPAELTIARDADAWCRSVRIQAVYDTSWDSLCVDAGGPTGGEWGSESDRRTATRFTRVE